MYKIKQRNELKIKFSCKLRSLPITQDHGGRWHDSVSFEKRRYLGSYKTREMAEVAFDLLKRKLAKKICNDKKSIDDLVK